MLNNLK